jgi:hypothetical protein
VNWPAGIVFVQRALLASGLLSMTVSPLEGATQSWTGSASPFWTDVGNWSSGFAPTAGDNLQFTLGNLNNRSNFNNYASSTTFGSLTIFSGNMVGYIFAGAPIGLSNGISASGTFASLTPVFDADVTFQRGGSPSGDTYLISTTRSLVFNGRVLSTNIFSSQRVMVNGGTVTFNGLVDTGLGDLAATNSGTLVLTSGARLQGGGIDLYGGLLRLNGAATNVAGNCGVGVYGPSSGMGAGGTLQGTGVVDNLVVGYPYPGGRVIPGDGGPGIFRCGTATLLGTLTEQINGTTPGTGYSQLVVGSNYTLAYFFSGCDPSSQAQLDLRFGYTPQLGDSFLIIKGPGTRTFVGLPYDSLADATNGYSFTVSYAPSVGVTLTTVRAPDSPFVLWKGSTNVYGNRLWSSSDSWAQGIIPTPGSRLQFTHYQTRDIGRQVCGGDTTPPPQTNDLTSGISLASLLFTDTNYVLYGNALTFTEGITNHITQGTNACFLNLVTAGPLVFDGDAGGGIVVGGSFNGSGTVKKEGGGELHYVGTTMNAFVGSVVVDNGILRADGSFTDGSFAVNGGLLTGTGTVSTITMTGGTLLPGASPGVLHVEGGVTMNTGAVLQVELNGPIPGSGYDQLQVSGTTALNGATLNLQPGYNATAGTAFLLLVNQGNPPIIGTFAGLPEGATFTAGGQYFSISYKAGHASNEVLVTRVNLPASFTSITQPSPGSVEIQALGGSNVSYIIQASTNLIGTNWLNIATAAANGSGLLSFTDTNASLFPQRFFRILTP